MAVDGTKFHDVKNCFLSLRLFHRFGSVCLLSYCEWWNLNSTRKLLNISRDAGSLIVCHCLSVSIYYIILCFKDVSVRPFAVDARRSSVLLSRSASFYSFIQ